MPDATYHMKIVRNTSPAYKNWTVITSCGRGTDRIEFDEISADKLKKCLLDVVNRILLRETLTEGG
jgi:hypothetical protein